MRGEYFTYFRCKIGYLELPPRARRILSQLLNTTGQQGTTSACAENTCCLLMRGTYGGNYLRVRGEYRNRTHNLRTPNELPPRARRIR